MASLKYFSSFTISVLLCCLLNIYNSGFDKIILEGMYKFQNCSEFICSFYEFWFATVQLFQTPVDRSIATLPLDLLILESFLIDDLITFHTVYIYNFFVFYLGINTFRLSFNCFGSLLRDFAHSFHVMP